MNRFFIVVGVVSTGLLSLWLTDYGRPKTAASQERSAYQLPEQWPNTPIGGASRGAQGGQQPHQFSNGDSRQAHFETQGPTRSSNRNAAWEQAARDWNDNAAQSNAPNAIAQTQYQTTQGYTQSYQASNQQTQQLNQPQQFRAQRQTQWTQPQPTQWQNQPQRPTNQQTSQFQSQNRFTTNQQRIPSAAQHGSGQRYGTPQYSSNQQRTFQGQQPRVDQWQSGLSNHYVQAHMQANGQSGVVTAHASVVQRGRVSANQWRGPTTKPVSRIQQVEYVYPQVQLQFEESTPNQLLSPFDERAVGYPDQINLPLVAGQLKELPEQYTPWWNMAVNQPMRGDVNTLPVDVDSLIVKAVEHSPQVIAMRIDPILRETEIVEEEAEFDWTAFLETEYDNTSDPIGNTLTAGAGINRFEDSNLTGRAGLRKRFDQGAQFDISQRLGYQDSNSTFFVPNRQGTSRLELNFAQPLLKGAGRAYNQGRIVLASINRNMTEDEVSANLQDHLVSVYQAYWSLYRARVVKLQKQRLLKRATDIQGRLEGRQGIDAVGRQVLRARAAVASRRSEIVRAEMAIRNAESRLRLLVNSPELKQSAQVELLPSELPMAHHIDISLKASIETSLRNRPEISRAIRQMKATSVRLGISKNELLPKLDLALGMYVAGLRGNGLAGRAVSQQFDRGRPSYSIGLFFEVPLGNRAARARAERREWEVAKAFRQFESAVEAGMTDVELAARQMETAYQEMLSRFQAMIAAETEANYLMERWRLLPGSDQTISFLLEDLLDAQERVSEQESDFVNAQIEYVLAVVSLKRAMGILVDCNNSPTSAQSVEAQYGSPGEYSEDRIEPLPELLNLNGPEPIRDDTVPSLPLSEEPEIPVPQRFRTR